MKRLAIPISLLFRALADPTRLRILHALRGGERCVCDLVALFELPQPTVSHHLAYLRRSGLVDCRKQGLWCYYQLAEPKSETHAKLLEVLGSCAEESPKLQADTQRLKRLNARRGCC